MRRYLGLLFILLASANSPASGQGYEFKGGFPTPEASRKSLDDTDFMRAVTAYRFFYPTVSMEGTIQGQRDAGAVDKSITRAPSFWRAVPATCFLPAIRIRLIWGPWSI